MLKRLVIVTIFSISLPAGAFRASIGFWHSKVLFSDTFENYTDGATTPAPWLTTKNDLTSDATAMEIESDSGNLVYWPPGPSLLTDFHSHVNSAGSDTWTNYEVTGRFKITNATASVGFIVFSDHPTTDTYYRIRRFTNAAQSTNDPVFTLVTHGLTMEGGTTVSSVNPSTNLNVWWRFKVQAKNTGSQTEIRGRFWLEGNSEPATWDIDAYDSSGNRIQGKPGFWANKAATTGLCCTFYDDIVVTSL